MNKDYKQIAKEIYVRHYIILFDSESDKGEEVLVSLLANKSAIATVEAILTDCKNVELYTKVLEYLKKGGCL